MIQFKHFLIEQNNDLCHLIKEAQDHKDHKMLQAIEDLIRRGKEKNNIKAIWDIITSIRGADSETNEHTRNEINNLCNHRIRAITGLIPLHPGNPEKRDKSFHEEPLTKKELKERDKLLKDCPYHFRTHYWKGVRGIKALYDWNLVNETPEKSLGYK